jgi:hypothetical protein
VAPAEDLEEVPQVAGAVRAGAAPAGPKVALTIVGAALVAVVGMAVRGVDGV